MGRRNGGRREHGFTLLEMMAAIVVLALAASVLMGGFGQSARSLAQVSSSERLDAAARSIMDELDSQPLDTGTQTGHWDGFDWRVNVVRVSRAGGSLALLRITLEVRDTSRSRRFVTLRARTERKP